MKNKPASIVAMKAAAQPAEKPLLTFSEAMLALDFLKEKLCGECGWRKATGSNMYKRICEECHKSAPLPAYQAHAGYGMSILEKALLEEVNRWVTRFVQP